MKQITWSPQAEAYIEEAFDFIYLDKPDAAQKTVSRIRSATATLLRFPNSGRVGSVSGTRELVVAGLPYVLIYEVHSNGIHILRVRHGAQQYPPQPPG